MPDRTQATILLAGQRLKKQTGHQFRSLSSFHQRVVPFGQLVLVADETLAPGSTTKIHAQAATTVLLLPLAGEINFQTAPGQESALLPGQAAWLTAGLEDQLLVANSYTTEYVNYLQIRFSDAVSFRQNQLQQATFDLDRTINQLSRLQVPGHLPIHIGKFGGRQEGSFVPDTASVFVFVIEGAFEVQNRLLETRDALMLKGSSIVEFEALSNNAILLILEAG